MADFAAGTIVLNTGTGNQTVSGLSFQPNSVLFAATPNVTADNTIATSAQRLVGAATSATERWCHAAIDVDNVGSGTCKTRFTTGKCLLGIDSAGAVLWEADFVGFTSDGFTINITTAPASAFIISFQAMNTVGAFAGAFTLPTVGATVSITATSFTPAAVIAAYGANADDAAEANYKFGFGFATAAEEMTMFVTGSDLVGTSRKQDAAASTKFLYGMLTGSTAVDWDASLATMDPTGFTVSIADNPSTAIRVGYLALSGVRAKAVTDTTKLTPTGTKATTGVGFQPESLLAFGIRDTSLTQTPANESVHTELGVSSGGSTTGTYTLQINGAGTEDSASIESTTWLISARSNTISSSTLVQASVSSFDPDGFTLNYSTVDSIEAVVYFLALADTPPVTAVPGQYVTHHIGRGAGW